MTNEDKAVICFENKQKVIYTFLRDFILTNQSVLIKTKKKRRFFVERKIISN